MIVHLVVLCALTAREVAGFVTRVVVWCPAMVAWLLMALSAEIVPGGTESDYGWCGLCHSFTVFPHECPDEQRPAPEEAL